MLFVIFIVGVAAAVALSQKKSSPSDPVHPVYKPLDDCMPSDPENWVETTVQHIDGNIQRKVWMKYDGTLWVFAWNGKECLTREVMDPNKKP